YKLNPGLSNKEFIRTKKKLNIPDFPILPGDQITSSIHSVQFVTPIPGTLKEQIVEFQSTLNIFRLNKLTLDSWNKQVNVDSIYSVLHHIEKTISSPDWMKGES